MNLETEKAAKKLLNQLWEKRNASAAQGEDLEEFDRGVFETLQWLLEGTTQPDIED